MAYPDQLKTPVSPRHPAFSALDGFLWEVAAWDPEAERVVEAAYGEGTDAELAEAARRLLAQRVLADPATVAVALRLLAQAGALGPDAVEALLRPVIPPGEAGSSLWDRYRASGPAVSRDADRNRGMRTVTRRRTGVRILAIYGPPGVGKTHLACDIVAALDQEEAGPRLEIQLTAPGPAVGAGQLPRAGYDALLDAMTQLGVSVEDVPVLPEQRRERYVSTLRDTGPVILLDGAADVSQVLPLLPPEEGIVVVTSRESLPGLAEHGAEFLPIGPLNVHGTRLLARACFPDTAAGPDEAAIVAIHELCGGMPLPTMVVSRWVARVGNVEELASVVLAERRAAAARAGEAAEPGASPGVELPAADTMSALLGLLGDDERAVARLLALLRVTEADIRVVRLGTGLDQARAQAALAQLAGLGLVERCGDGRAWAMPPLAADYVCADAVRRGHDLRIELEQVLVKVVGWYQLRAESLRDLMAAPELEALPQLRAWAGAQWAAEPEPAAMVLAGAEVCVRPALARGLAAAYLAATRRADDWRETDRYLAPLLMIARDAGDHELEASVLFRFGCEAIRRGEKAAAVTVLEEAQKAARSAGDSALEQEVGRALDDARPPTDTGPDDPGGASAESPEPGGGTGESEALIGLAVPPRPMLFGGHVR